MTDKKSKNIDELINDAVEKSKMLLSRSTLNKYVANPIMNQRLVDDASNGKTTLSLESGYEKYKRVSAFEMEGNFFDFFKLHRSAMQSEFKDQFLNQIGPEKYHKYVHCFAHIWTKGRQGRRSKEVQSLMQSVYDFLALYGGQSEDLISGKFSNETHSPMFSIEETKALLLINKCLLDYYFQEYAHLVSNKQPALGFSTNDIWLHRGIDLDVEWEEEQKYVEKDFLNSYSLSVGVSEKFSSIMKRSFNSVVSWQAYDLIDQVFAFFGFIPEMCDNQLEVITVPTHREAQITQKNVDPNIVDYEISYFKSFNNQVNGTRRR